MLNRSVESGWLTPELLIRAYSAGIFPMAESRTCTRIHWIDPRRRGILPLDAVHVPRRLARTYRKRPFVITADRAFEQVIAHCAAPAPGRRDTWINAEIERVYIELHRMGVAHSIECWRDDQLVGGLYGVKLGSAFFGESMFSLATDASKVAFIALTLRLLNGGFTLFDVQFHTDHLGQFGVVEIPARHYLTRLADAIERPAQFLRELSPEDESRAVSALRQSITQTS